MKITVVMLLALSLTPISTQAMSIDVGFQRISSNNLENVEGQLGLDIMDQADAWIKHELDIDSTQVLFAFTNDVGVASNVAEVYIDDGTILWLSTVINSQALGLLPTGYTNFAAAPPLHPGNLPGWAMVSPQLEATTALSADTVSGPPKNGIEQSLDTLGIVYTVSNGGIIGIQEAINDGRLRIGLHVRSIGQAGGSDSFINSGGPTTIPDPAAVFLLGSACLIGFAAARRKFIK